jgi:CheY-like chemotaxis protein
LRQLLDDTMKSQGPRAHEKGLELAVRISPGVPLDLVGDALRLRQVLVVLLSNAIKFADRGEIVLEVTPDGVEDGEIRLRFCVRDSVLGSSSEDQQHAWESFAPAEGSESQRFGGAGLDLSIASRLANKMGGRIWAQGEPGRGSTFCFTARFGRAAVAAVQEAAAELGGVKLLIVDDSAMNRRVLAELATTWRMQPTCVANGCEALAELRRAQRSPEPFALVLLDAVLPAMDGFEVARHCQEEGLSASAVIMMLSPTDSDADFERCQAAGVAGYLVKPISSSELRDMMVRALGLSSRLPAPVGQVAAADRKPRECPPLTILLAEDNVFNARMAVRLLENDGHGVQCVTNGVEVLQAVACENFDLVLMDVQMPEMDGLEATRNIRRKEEATGRHLPIVAMTAHAMEGDRERCLAAGMDDYLSKPIDPVALRAALRRVSVNVPASGAGKSEAGQGADNAAWTRGAGAARPRGLELEVLDLDGLRARVEGDLDLLAEMLELYLDTSPALLQEIETALASCDAQRSARAAHSLKGVLRNLCAVPCAQAAAELETLVAAGDIDGAERTLGVLKDRFDALREVVADTVKRNMA